jgi:hypothetical protein
LFNFVLFSLYGLLIYPRSITFGYQTRVDNHRSTIVQMLKQIAHTCIPATLHGPLLIDENGLPRYWATVWQLFLCGDLAHSTQSKHLRHIEALYQFAAELDGAPALDDAISTLDMPGLSQILEGYFIAIRNKNTDAGNAQEKWRNAYEFVRAVVLRHTRNNSSTATLHKLEAKLSRLDMLYQQLQISRRRTQETIRSLPASVVEALYEMLDPASASNPFRNDFAKWRVFVLFVILLHQGLRRGEALNLPTDVVKSEFDSKAGSLRNWLAVATADTDIEDTRYNKPSIKNAQSIRQIPVSSLTANTPLLNCQCDCFTHNTITPMLIQVYLKASNQISDFYRFNPA